MEFCVETIEHAPQLRPDHGVIRDAALRVTAEATLAAAQIRDQAVADAEELRQHARVEIDAARQAVEAQTLERAAQLIKCLEDQQQIFLEQAQATVVDLALALFERLVMDQTPRKRAETLLKRLQTEAPARLNNARLWIHPDDAALLPALDWELRPDDSMVRGTCRLEASSGDWCVDFPAAIDTIKASFSAAAGAALAA